jgi:hypothetical protein
MKKINSKYSKSNEINENDIYLENGQLNKLQIIVSSIDTTMRKNNSIDDFMKIQLPWIL